MEDQPTRIEDLIDYKTSEVYLKSEVYNVKNKDL